VDRLKGKFRSFLLACFQNYLSVETHRAHRLKRGGQYQFVSLELETAEDRCRYEPADHLTAEKIFEARWALTLLDHAVTLLRREYVARGRESVFEILKPFIGTMESKPEDSYEEAAKTLGVGVGTVKTLIHRLPGPGFAEEADGGSQVRRFENYEVTLDDDGKPIELGRGAMGVTYKAFDVDLHCPVTLKVIGERYLGDESARLRFLREARAAARLRHSKVASVLNLGRTGSSYFYAMEFVEGETFENLIKRSGRLEVKLALEIAMQVAAGLAAVRE
jgi:Protein kinase domain